MMCYIRAASWENQQFAYAKTKAQISFAVTAKLISAFVFATRIVQFLFYLNPKFQACSSFLCLYSPVCVGPVRKPHCWFSHEVAQNLQSSQLNRRGCRIYNCNVNIVRPGLHFFFILNHPHYTVYASIMD